MLRNLGHNHVRKCYTADHTVPPSSCLFAKVWGAALTMGILVKIPVYVVFYSISLFYGLLVLFGLLWSVIRRPGILSIKKNRRESESKVQKWLKWRQKRDRKVKNGALGWKKGQCTYMQLNCVFSNTGCAHGDAKLILKCTFAICYLAPVVHISLIKC